MEKVLVILNVINFFIILCMFILFIELESFFIWRKVILLLDLRDGILGKINIIICKVGLIFLDCYNLWLV